MLAVTAYSVFLKKWDVAGIEMKGFEMILANSQNMIMFFLGNIIAFAVAVFAIKFFIEMIKKYGFKMWGYYRIVLGICLLISYTFFK
jgi:undecaprenyl-diphosphatase